MNDTTSATLHPDVEGPEACHGLRNLSPSVCWSKTSSDFYNTAAHQLAPLTPCIRSQNVRHYRSVPLT